MSHHLDTLPAAQNGQPFIDDLCMFSGDGSTVFIMDGKTRGCLQVCLPVNNSRGFADFRTWRIIAIDREVIGFRHVDFLILKSI